MQQNQETWTRSHDLALIFIALAYGADRQLADSELASITNALRRWRPEAGEDDIQEIIVEAVAIFLESDADEEVARSIRSLKTALEVEQRCKALEDAMHIAEADGILKDSETSLIAVLADIWEVTPTQERLMDESSALIEDSPQWSLLHDMALLYIVLAHGSDNKLSSIEIAAMTERLTAWQPDLDTTEIETILREALQYYSQGPSKEDLDESATRHTRGILRGPRDWAS